MKEEETVEPAQEGDTVVRKNWIGRQSRKLSGRKKWQECNHSKPFHLVDNEVHGIFVKMRSEGRKVPASWIGITAKGVFDRMRAENPNQWEGVSFDAYCRGGRIHHWDGKCYWAWSRQWIKISKY